MEKRRSISIDRPFILLAILIMAGLITACASKPGEPYTTDSGLTIQVMKAGRGQKVVKGHTVTVHFTLWLDDGTLVQSSKQGRGGSGRAYTVENIGMGQVISGWNEGIIGMRVGEIRRLICPPDLAYRVEGRPPAIPGNATLTFEIELLEAK